MRQFRALRKIWQHWFGTGQHAANISDNVCAFFLSKRTGHGIMASSGPFLRTATHKGTSTLWQTPLESSLLDCEDPTIDVMHYHAGLSPNCRNVTEAEVPAVLLGEEEAAALVRNSEAGARPPLCPPVGQDLSYCGGFCLTSLDCGGSCSRCECFSCAGIS